jgi:hypothetical protein
LAFVYNSRRTGVAKFTKFQPYSGILSERVKYWAVVSKTDAGKDCRERAEGQLMGHGSVADMLA